MRVKRLEIQGFKSFKDKTVVHFDHNITGVVGPNGCGKSNIVDAFFWVMGEQSYKHIRGSGSDDLIFNGSSRHPALGMAEATLVLETDYVDTENAPTGASVQDLPVTLRSKEISVTRRVYRGGEGEYFINGLPSRLKDIHELFMDTGVGTKGYSVIEQGQIGKIINSKPDDRRILIEEAAGIAKYKARKKESLRKMEAAKGNLDRLADVVAEIERNLSSLERQAQKARKYNEYKSELLSKEVTWGRRKQKILTEKLNRIREQKALVEQNILALRASLQISENAIEAQRIEELTRTQSAEEIQTRLQALAGELAHEQSALELSKKRQDDLKAQLEKMVQEIEILRSEIEGDRAALETKQSEILSLESNYEVLSSENAVLFERVQASRFQTEEARRGLENARQTLMQQVSESSELMSQSSSLRVLLESSQDQLKRLEENAQEYEQKLAQGQTDRVQLEERLQTSQGNIQSLESNLQERQSDRVTIEKALKDLRGRDQQAQRDFAQAQSRLESLEELDRVHEGLTHGPKAVLDWNQQQGGARGITLLADHFSVQDGFDSIVESWLGSRIEFLLSDQASEAWQAIAALRESKAGRAEIQIGGALSSESDAGDIQSLENFLSACGVSIKGRLLNQITPKSDTVRGVIARFFEKVLVVDSLEVVLQKDFQQVFGHLNGWSLIDVQGTVLSPEGCVRGGSLGSGRRGEHLGTKRSIEQLRLKVQELESNKNTLLSEIEDHHQRLDVVNRLIEQLKEKRQQAQIEFATLKRDMDQSAKSLREWEGALAKVGSDIQRIREQILSCESKIETASIRVEEIHSKKSELESDLEHQRSKVKALEEELRKFEEDSNHKRIQEASSRERLQSLRREKDALDLSLQSKVRRLGEIERLLERVRLDHEQHSGGDVAMVERIGDLTKSKSELDSSLRQIKEEIELARGLVTAHQEKVKGSHHEIDAQSQMASELAIEIERLSGEYQHLIQNLEEKYGPGCLNAVESGGAAVPEQEEMKDPIVTAEMTEEEERFLGEEVERLRERMRRLGEVNPMAVEEFDLEKARHENLTGQRDDLIQSIRDLEEAIEHINKTSEERFRKAFEAIAERFEKLFPIIFGGGKAQLSLVYPEGVTSILEAGVDILAQPPGKKIVNIGLLSGGEKALTALSLVFAVFMVKPSPFCILDEVDAPLDDANIGKFNALLKEMAEKTQFILITHNKKTMELNDTLYGVTMEEPGVSKMVSIEMH